MTSYGVVSPDNSHHSDQESGNGPESSMREQDKLLPIANVGRIMKRAIPVNGKISKEAKETVQECVSEFISFITGEASEKCQREKRKTVNGDDLLWAMGTLGFEEYMEPLKLYLHRYREMEGEKSSMARQCEEESNINTAGGYQGNNSGSASAAQLYVHPLNPMLYSQHQLDPPYQIPMPTNGGLIGGGAAEYSGTRLATYK